MARARIVLASIVLALLSSSALACESGQYKGSDGKCHPLPKPKEPPPPPPTW